MRDVGILNIRFLLLIPASVAIQNPPHAIVSLRFYSSTFAVDYPSIASLRCTAVDGAALVDLS